MNSNLEIVVWDVQHGNAIYMKTPNAGQIDLDGYHYGNDTFGLQHKYEVIRLADLEGESFLEAKSE
ncbi:hypothetical protein C6501_06840 [Candidatus Poribacteria bacterium]|nr:MAG: hypothetical protein C6501_06840 [Candidatus Poribacteria bacterium]